MHETQEHECIMHDAYMPHLLPHVKPSRTDEHRREMCSTKKALIQTCYTANKTFIIDMAQFLLQKKKQDGKEKRKFWKRREKNEREWK